MEERSRWFKTNHVADIDLGLAVGPVQDAEADLPGVRVLDPDPEVTRAEAGVRARAEARAEARARVIAEASPQSREVVAAIVNPLVSVAHHPSTTTSQKAAADRDPNQPLLIRMIK